MAKKLLLSLLLKVLGEFIDVNEENLNLAVWSGQIVLNNLKLKTNKLLENYNLSIPFGVIKTLEINIPWATLLTNPIKIKIDGVYLQINPCDIREYDKAKSVRRLLNEKLQQIKLVDEFIELSSHANNEGNSTNNSNPNDNSYLQQWATKIVDNIEVSISNIHLRYEDHVTVPNKIFAVGITFASFEISTCDSSWQNSSTVTPYAASLTSHTPSSNQSNNNSPRASNNSTIYKVANIYNLGVYWDTESSSLTNLPLEEWEKIMQGLIYARNAPTKLNLQYLLHPYNNLVLRFRHCKKPMEATMPTYDLFIQSTNLAFSFDSIQYQQFFNTVDRALAIKRYVQLDSFYPNLRPSSPEGAQQWWKYATKMIIKRPRYIQLVKKEKAHHESNNHLNSMTAFDKLELNHMNEKIPIQTLKVFRQAAMNEYYDDLKRLATKESVSKQSSGGWWSGWLGSSSTAESEHVDGSLSMSSAEDISIESIINNLKKIENNNSQIHLNNNTTKLEEKSDEMLDNKTIIKAVLETSATLTFSFQSVPLTTFKMSASCSVYKTVSGITLICELGNMSALDKYTITPPIPYLISVKSDTSPIFDNSSQNNNNNNLSGNDSQRNYLNSSSSFQLFDPNSESTPIVPTFSFKLENHYNKTKIKISALPIQICLNKDCIQKILTVFSRPPNPYDFNSKMNNKSNKKSQINNRKSASPSVGSIASRTLKSINKINNDYIILNSLSPSSNNHNNTHNKLQSEKNKNVTRENADDIEIEFEANAPKIIIPEDASSDKGYLLLDTGYLKMRGILSSSGFLFDLSLTEINAGMPLTIHDMYTFKNNSSYLIKPFGISMQVQNIKKTFGEMTVNIKIEPEVRGEIDSIKLSRLLSILNVASSAFSRTPIPRNRSNRGLNDIALIEAFQNSSQTYDSASTTPVTPFKQNLSKSMENSSHTDHAVHDEEIINPENRNIHIEVSLPVCAVNLTYNVANDYQLQLEIHDMFTTVIMRPYDRQLLFNLGSISIKDSCRNAQQEYLVWTPPSESGKLINVSCINIHNRRSPFYVNHAMDVVANFSHLCLNADVNTILHLKPFFEVLLAKKKENTVGIQNKSQTITSSNNNLSNQSNDTIIPNDNIEELDIPPMGMQITATLEKISLDLLRTPEIEHVGALLDSTFSIQISQLSAKIITNELLKAEVSLGSFDIFDIRKVSKDYVFKRIFCPLDQSLMESEDHDDSIFRNESNSNNSNLIELTYNQESKSQVYVTIVVANVASFIAIDTILDFINVATANAFAFLNLLSPSPTTASNDQMVVQHPAIDEGSRSTPSTPKCFNGVNNNNNSNNNMQELSNINYSTTTMNVMVTVVNPRLILLEDPSSPESQAIVARCGVEVHYSREIMTPIKPIQRQEPLFPINYDLYKKESFESLHLTVTKYEVFVLNNMKKWIPQSILDPFALECHLKRKVVGNEPIYTKIHIDLDSIMAKVSFRDLFLAQSILSRRSLTELSSDPDRITKEKLLNEMNMERLSHSKSDNRSNAINYNNFDSSEEQESPFLIFNFCLSSLSVVIVNDFNGQNVPILRALVDDSKFYLEESRHHDDATRLLQQKIRKLKGDGFVNLKIDFYNALFSVWEPVLDIWRPEVNIYSKGNASVLEIKSDHTMQVTVSGYMLETLLRSYTLFLMPITLSMDASKEKRNYCADEEISMAMLIGQQAGQISSSNGKGDSVSDIVIYNLLGGGIDLEIFETRTKKLILTLYGSKQCSTLSSTESVQRVHSTSIEYHDSTQYHLREDNKHVGFRSLFGESLVGKTSSGGLPTAVDINFCGTLTDQRMPLRHLPFNLNKPKLYYVQPSSSTISKLSESPKSESISSKCKSFNKSLLKSAHKVMVIEPIVEEVYENSRYDLVSGTWKSPFFLGDPNEWTDASGTIRKDINKIGLMSDRWEWLGKWEIDKEGIIGSEIDEDGWEYAASFSFFSIVSARRTKQTMDCVRRRRWTRTRIPASSSSNDLVRPMPVFWDVQLLKNGSRKVDVRSGFQVRNHLNVPIIIALRHNSWLKDVEYGPIYENQLFSVPLLHAFATWICFRPFSSENTYGHNWSQLQACNIQSYDFVSTKDVSCSCEERGIGSAINVMDEAIKALEETEEDQQENKNDATKHGVKLSNLPFFFRARTAQTNKSLLISLFPHITIKNKLLCTVSFRCYSSTNEFEEGQIKSGLFMKLTHINTTLHSQARIVFKIGGFEWSDAQLIRQPDVADSNKNPYGEIKCFDLRKSTSSDKIAKTMTLSYRTNLTEEYCIEISVFSSAAVIDRTGLDLYICSKSIANNQNLVQTTCANNIFQQIQTSPYAYPDVTFASKNNSIGGNRSRRSTISDVELDDSNSINITDDTVSLHDDRVSILSSVMNYSPSHQDFQNCSEMKETDSKIINTIFQSENRQVNKSNRKFYDVLINDELFSLQPKFFTNLKVSSHHKYDVVLSDVNSTIYTQLPDIRWIYLPTLFRQQLFVSASQYDRRKRTNQLIKLNLLESCLVFIFMDSRVKPDWLSLDGFECLSEIAVASHRIDDGHTIEYYYNIYGKYYSESLFCLANYSFSDEVIFRSNNNHGNVDANMYTVCIIPYDPALSRISSKYSSLDKIYEQVNYNKRALSNPEIYSSSWVEGSNHVTFLHANNGMISIGAYKGTVWSDEINIDMVKNASGKGSLEIDHYTTPSSTNAQNNPNTVVTTGRQGDYATAMLVDNQSNKQISYQISYHMQFLPGLYNETQLITLFPRYVILNCTNEKVFISQTNSALYCEYLPYQPEGWHKLDRTMTTNVHFQLPDTNWSLGSVDLNEIGTSVLLIPFIRSNTGKSSHQNGIALHIEVKLGGPNDNCSILVMIWKENMDNISNPPLMYIQNDSEVPVTVRQADIELDHDINDLDLKLFEIIAGEFACCPFGWADSEAGSYILLCVGEGLQGNNKRIATINLFNTDQPMRLPFQHNGKKGEVIISVESSNRGGHRILISPMSKNYLEKILQEESQRVVDSSVSSNHFLDMNSPLYGLNFVLTSFGLSLVVEKPTRRELFSLYVDDLELRLKSSGSTRSLEFMIMDLQLDNYSETVIHPVMLRSNKKEIHSSVTLDDEQDNIIENSSTNIPNNNNDDDKIISNEVPFIEFTLIQEINDSKSPSLPVTQKKRNNHHINNGYVIKYIGLRVLPLIIELDSATVQILYTDLLADLKVFTQSQALATTVPSHWIEDFNYNTFSPKQKSHLINIIATKTNTFNFKIYFQKLVIHPLKVTLTFLQTIFPRRLQSETFKSALLNVILSIVGVEKLQLRLNSFEVEEVMESIDSLNNLLINNYIQELRRQLASIAGSLTLIGSPIGFARKVGSGVKAFFYEPYLGAVYGSNDFFTGLGMGLGKGTTSLFSGVVTGAMDSAGAIVGTASKGLSHLSGDADYIRKRAIKRQQNRANRGGIVEGIKYGGESILSGFSSGVQGLVSKPFEEASKGGFQGFLRGVGLGLVGAAVKPMMGFADGISSVAYGISNQVDQNRLAVHVRPPRALEPSPFDSSHLIVSQMNLQAAFEQHFVIKRAKSSNFVDSFVAYIPLDHPGESITLSEVYIYWRRNNHRALWGRIWANVSHCVYMKEAIGLMLYTVENSNNFSVSNHDTGLSGVTVNGSNNYGGELVVIACGSVAAAKRLYHVFVQNSHRMGNPSKVIPADVILDHEPDNYNDHAAGAGTGVVSLNEQIKESALLSELDGYRFGKANNVVLPLITGPGDDVIKRCQITFESKGYINWQDIDQQIWRLLWEWGCVYSSISMQSFCRCSVSLFINKTDTPIQITRVQMIHGRNVIIMGSDKTGYEVESRCIMPMGVALVFIYAFPQSPIEIGHIKANVHTAAFSAVIASTQRETWLESKEGFSVGFLEKTVCEWWSKYVIIIN
eukprot:gene7511-10233_t